MKKLKSLGAIISVNPYYVTGFSEKFGEVGLGKERAHAMVRLATIEKEKIPVSLHSDAPMAPSIRYYSHGALQLESQTRVMLFVLI